MAYADILKLVNQLRSEDLLQYKIALHQLNEQNNFDIDTFYNSLPDPITKLLDLNFKKHKAVKKQIMSNFQNANQAKDEISKDNILPTILNEIQLNKDLITVDNIAKLQFITKQLAKYSVSYGDEINAEIVLPVNDLYDALVSAYHEQIGVTQEILDIKKQADEEIAAQKVKTNYQDIEILLAANTKQFKDLEKLNGEVKQIAISNLKKERNLLLERQTKIENIIGVAGLLKAANHDCNQIIQSANQALHAQYKKLCEQIDDRAIQKLIFACEAAKENLTTFLLTQSKHFEKTNPYLAMSMKLQHLSVDPPYTRCVPVCEGIANLVYIKEERIIKGMDENCRKAFLQYYVINLIEHQLQDKKIKDKEKRISRAADNFKVNLPLLKCRLDSAIISFIKGVIAVLTCGLLKEKLFKSTANQYFVNKNQSTFFYYGSQLKKASLERATDPVITCAATLK